MILEFLQQGCSRNAAWLSGDQTQQSNEPEKRVLRCGHGYFLVILKWSGFVGAAYMANLSLSVAICYAGGKQWLCLDE